ncbi:winged helix-turn-helix domain-containing protein [Microbacterium sp. JZ31]|uniref:winged helix-turn-helix domain-containing protein n=1 Tax=Microbacterium sp. JZ31 TaxID=1906274 RepID=UPI001EE4DC72|nr:crosslink repair DNA glycosylase YcaQ family protein [Microbacterium sp. JZ31]
MKQHLSLPEARRVALAAQGFARPRPDAPGTRQLNGAIARMGVLQIDSVNVFARSHYMPLFSRLGAYDTGDLDRLVLRHGPGGRPRRTGAYVEYLAHEATFLPIDDWPLWRFRMDAMRAKYGGAGSWYDENAATVDWVRDELAARGPLRPAQIESDAHRGRRGPWWDWDVVKRALELMWRFGEVAIAGRRGFERRYALAQDVVPAPLLDAQVPRDDAIRELLRRAARASGVATAADLADYHRIRDRRAVLAAVHELVDDGELAPVTVDGWTRGAAPLPAWVHRDAVLPRRIDAATLLTPFDPVVWFRERAERLFGFDYRIEIYTPAPRRRFGYYSLPVLVDDRIVGRVDLKADRPAATLRVQSAWWEAGVPAITAERVAVALREAAAWQGLAHISISTWGDATADLAFVMPDAARHDRPAVEPQPEPEAGLDVA